MLPAAIDLAVSMEETFGGIEQVAKGSRGLSVFLPSPVVLVFVSPRPSMRFAHRSDPRPETTPPAA